MRFFLPAAAILSLHFTYAAAQEKPTQPVQAQPADEKRTVAATLLGRDIKAVAGDDLNGLIFRDLSEQFIQDNGIKPTEEEIAGFNEALDRKRRASVEQWTKDKETLKKELKSPNLTLEQISILNEKMDVVTKLIEAERQNDERKKANPAEDRESRNQVASQLILVWKFSQSLHKKYGGRVIFQQSGPEPIDAYRDFLKEHETKGSFKIHDEDARKRFWEYFSDDAKHQFYPEDEGKKMMTSRWWLGME